MANEAKNVTVYAPLDAPVKGLASSRQASLVPPGSGYFKKLENWRWGKTGVLTVRGGVSELDDSAISSNKTVWGGGLAVFNGVYDYQFVGLKSLASDPSRLGAWYTIDGATWNEATISSTKYGDAGLLGNSTSKSDCPMSVALVHDRFTERDVFIFQNGVDYPVVWPDSNSSTNAVKHEPIEPPVADTRCRALFYWENPVPVGTATSFSVDNTGTGSNWDIQEVGSTPLAVCRVSATAGGTAFTGNGDMEFATSYDWSGSKQVVLCIKGSGLGISHFMQNAKITLVDTGNDTVVIFDAADATKRNAAIVPLDGRSDLYAVGLSLEFAGGTSLTTSAIDTLRVSWNTNTPDPGSNYNIDIVLVSGSGQVRGGGSYALTYYNSGSKAESYSQVLPSATKSLREMGATTALGSTVSNLFGSMQSRYDTALVAPFSEDLYFSVGLSFVNTGSGDMGKGVDTLRVYRHDLRDPEGEFYYCKGVPIAAFTGSPGSWGFSSGSAGSLRTDATDNTASEARLLWLTDPGAFHQCVPIGRAMLSANGRLFVGAEASEGSASYQRLSASRPGSPFRHTNAGFQDDPATAIEEYIQGESVMAMVASSASLLGSSSVYVFTSRAVHLVNTAAAGTQGYLQRVASIGTGSPLSVVEHDGRIYFVGSDMRAYRLSGNGLEVLSLQWVDDLLSGIPDTRRHLVCGAWFDYAYHISYTPEGDTVNSRKLVFSELPGAWESNDVSPEPSDGETCWEYISRFRPLPPVTDALGLVGESWLIGIGSDCLPYRLEDGATDLDGTVQVRITTGDIQQSYSNGLSIRRVAVVGDAQNNTLTTTRTYKPSGITASSSLSLNDASSPYRWQYDMAGGVTTKVGTGEANGIAGSLEISGGIDGGSQILAILFEVEPRQLRANGGNP